jgi:hypothetical protein
MKIMITTISTPCPPPRRRANHAEQRRLKRVGARTKRDGLLAVAVAVVAVVVGMPIDPDCSDA